MPNNKSDIVIIILTVAVVYVIVIAATSHLITGVQMSEAKAQLFAYTVGQVIGIITMWVGGYVKNDTKKEP